MNRNKIVHIKGAEKPKRNIPNILIIYFLSFLFACGLDFGFSKVLKKNLQPLSSCFCGFLSISITISMFIEIVYKIDNGQLKTSSWLIYGLIQYSIHAISLWFSKYNLYNLMNDVHSIDTTIKRNNNKDRLILNLFIIFIWINVPITVASCYFICTSTVNGCDDTLPEHIFCVLIMDMGVITIAQILMYFYIYKAVKYLNISLEDKDIGKEIQWVWKQFTAIADICDKISPIYGRLVIVQILSNLPRALETLWAALYFIKSGATFDVIMSRVVMGTKLILQLFVPSVVVEMASAQSEVLKSILHNRLVEESDNKKKQEIISLLRYIEDRPFHRRAWRIIPVDAKLITSLVSLCTTYFIVIIQFSHLYD